MPSSKPDLARLDDVVANRVLDAMRSASSQLARLGVRHLLLGGLAEIAHGHASATTELTFLVGDEAFEHHEGGLVTMRPGVPIQASGVMVNHLSANETERFLADSLPPPGAPLTVAPIEIVAYLKLKSPRAKDRADLIELIKSGIDLARCRDFIARNAPPLSAALAEAEANARAEE